MKKLFASIVPLCAAACAGDTADEIGERSAPLTPVAWTDVVGVTADTVDGLGKTAPETAFNAGAVSVATLAGDGFVEFTTGESTSDKAIGLSTGNGGQGLADIDFAIRLNASGRASIDEGGINRGGIGPYAAGDVFRVQAEDGVVTYWRNGKLKYTSALAPSFPLLVDTSLRTPGATLTDVRIEPIDFWTAPVGVTLDGHDITKTAPEDQYNAGAASVNGIASGDGYVEFRAGEPTGIVAAGLSHGNANASRNDIDFAIQLNDSAGVGIFEGGFAVGSFGPYRAGDIFRVAVRGGVVRYYRNRVLLTTSTRAPSYPLLLDASIRTPGASILGGKLVAGYATDECAPAVTTLPETPFWIAAEGDVMVAGDQDAVPPVAIVYRETPDGWVFEQDLPKPVGPTQTTWAHDVATDGQTIAVLGGAVYQQPGYLQLYRHDGNQWAADGRIDPCPDGDDDGLISFAVLGDVLVTGESTPARLRVYRRVGGNWTLDALLTNPDGGRFNYSVSLGGDRLFASAPSSPSTPDGAAHVYRYNPALADVPPSDPCGAASQGKWRHKSTLVPAAGHFYGGLSADTAGNRLLIDDSSDVDDIHVLQLDAGAWNQVGTLIRTPFDPIFGSPEFAGPDEAGAVVGGSATWVYGELDDGWTQLSYDNIQSYQVAATADTVFSIDTINDVIVVHHLDPLCFAE
jgi:hypothetical protein